MSEKELEKLTKRTDETDEEGKFKLNFEAAAELRDKISRIKETIEKDKAMTEKNSNRHLLRSGEPTSTT